MPVSKPFCISKWAVHSAWTRVRENRGAAGVDDVTIAGFEKRLKNNLYRIWNRMSSGAYFPPPVRRVMIPKKGWSGATVRYTYRGRSSGPNGREDESGAEGGTTVPLG